MPTQPEEPEETEGTPRCGRLPVQGRGLNGLSALFRSNAGMLFSNMLWSATGRAAGMIGAMLGTILVARHLGVDEFGQLNYIVSFALLFQPIAHFGTDNIVTREIARKELSADKVLGTAIVVRLGAAFVAMLALLLFAYWLEPHVRAILAMMLFSSAFLAEAFHMVRCYFVGAMENRFVAASEVSTVLLSLSVKVVLVWCNAPMGWFVGALALDSFLLSGVLLFLYHRRRSSLQRLRFNVGLAKYLVVESLPLILSLAAAMVHQRIDQVMLHKLAGTTAVGQFVAGVRVVSVILFLPQIIAETCSPYLVKARQHSEALFDSRFRLMSAALFWSAVLGAAVISLLARPIIGFLFGAEYLGASAVTAILAWKTVLMALSVSSAHWIIIAGQQRWIAIRNLLGCGANIALNMVLIPRYGAIGASVATLVSFLCASYVAHLLICGYRPLFWHQTASIFRGPGILVGAVRERFRASAR